MPDPEVAAPASFSTVFGKALCEAAAADRKICAITAAMKYGTGLQFFGHAFRDRFFDVGMAEQHAVTFAAGLASQGMVPVAAIYSTFLQRAYDQIIHDVCLLRVKVIFAIDRGGPGTCRRRDPPGGIRPAFLSEAGMPIYSPSNYAELRYWLLRLVGPDYTGPQAIRYPRGGEVKALAQYGCTGRAYDFLTGGPEADTVLVSYGSEVEDVLAAAALLEAEGVPCRVCKLVKVFPFTDDFIHEIERFKTILFAEECVRQGSIGQQLAARLLADGWQRRLPPPGGGQYQADPCHRPRTERDPGPGRRKPGAGRPAGPGSGSRKGAVKVKIRLDQYLVQHGLIQSRERAKAMIMAGVVYVNGQKADKAGDMVKEDAVVEVRGHDIGYVSRAASSWKRRCRCSPSAPRARSAWTSGPRPAASPTVCCRMGRPRSTPWTWVRPAGLEPAHRPPGGEYGADQHPQRHPRPVGRRHRIFQRGRFVHLPAPHFPGGTGGDHPRRGGGLLVKPQFEAGREKVGKNGVVRDPATHRKCW